MENDLDILIVQRRELKEQVRRLSKEINRSKCRSRYPHRKNPRKSPEEMITARRLYARNYYRKQKWMAEQRMLKV
jgi:hypothetical protein